MWNSFTSFTLTIQFVLPISNKTEILWTKYLAQKHIGNKRVLITNFDINVIKCTLAAKKASGGCECAIVQVANHKSRLGADVIYKNPDDSICGWSKEHPSSLEVVAAIQDNKKPHRLFVRWLYIRGIYLRLNCCDNWPSSDDDASLIWYRDKRQICAVDGKFSKVFWKNNWDELFILQE